MVNGVGVLAASSAHSVSAKPDSSAEATSSGRPVASGKFASGSIASSLSPASGHLIRLAESHSERPNSPINTSPHEASDVIGKSSTVSCSGQSQLTVKGQKSPASPAAQSGVATGSVAVGRGKSDVKTSTSSLVNRISSRWSHHHHGHGQSSSSQAGASKKTAVTSPGETVSGGSNNTNANVNSSIVHSRGETEPMKSSEDESTSRTRGQATKEAETVGKATSRKQMTMAVVATVTIASPTSDSAAEPVRKASRTASITSISPSIMALRQKFSVAAGDGGDSKKK
ncbi:unnamed protein product [Protopolystoma xenopodis]|uniref:Uncharacterized protein n=1 Tax=Protopolystoma xenopodis TaxID=117903 RepID=A0A448WMQ2_9PLAT|nr:unnamed protein product [Protopolystoma xenopodis]